MFVNVSAKVLIRSLFYLGINPLIVVLVGFGEEPKSIHVFILPSLPELHVYIILKSIF